MKKKKNTIQVVEKSRTRKPKKTRQLLPGKAATWAQNPRKKK